MSANTSDSTTNGPATDSHDDGFAEIVRAVHLLTARNDDGVTELRAINGTRVVGSGYYNDSDALARDAIKVNDGANVYVTLNPVNPALRARSNNRVTERPKSTTSDNDILRRTWLPIDCDPIRPAYISASDDEHQTALERARDIQDWLRGQGFPETVLADSGNGGHVLIPIDLPNDPDTTRLISNVLLALAARFDDHRVTIDTSVSNASRVWKLYGTIARKGDPVDDRAHRQARLIDVPQKLEPVGKAYVESVANAVMDPPPKRNGKRHRKLHLEAWMEEHGLHAVRKKPWNGGDMYVLGTCPWNPAHTDRSAYITQLPDGRIVAGCHHNGCEGKTFASLRDTLEPGWRDQDSAQSNSRVVRQVAEQLDVPFVKDAGQNLWAFRDGRYVPDGEITAIAELRKIYDAGGFGERDWSTQFVNSVTGYVRAGAREVELRPDGKTINVLNGRVDLDTKELLSHSPDDFNPVQLPIIYDPDAECPNLEQVYRDWFPEDINAAGVPWQILIFLASGVHFKKALLLMGEGDNGKSIYGHSLKAFLGVNNMAAVTLHALENSRFAAHEIVGKLVNFCGDLPGTDIVETSVFKQIVGGDTIRVEPKGLRGYSYHPFCHLVFASNTDLQIKVSDTAWLDRWSILPFNPTIPREKQRPEKEMQALVSEPRELSGALNKALAAWNYVKSHGIAQTASMVEMLDDYRNEADPFTAWVRNCVKPENGTTIVKAVLRDTYNAYAAGERSRLTWMTDVMFGRQFKRSFKEIYGYEPAEGRGKVGPDSSRHHHWTNVKLTIPVQLVTFHPMEEDHDAVS